VLNHLKLVGDTSGNAVWRDLDAALDTVFPLADGRKLQLAATAVDSGFNADQVMSFVRGRQRKHFLTAAVKGVGGFDKLPLAQGGRLKGQMRLMIIGVDTVKHTTQKQLAMEQPGPGYIRLPSHLPSEYFEGLASEELRVRTIKGVPKYEYHRIVRQNEPLDCLNYASAIARMVNVKTTPSPAKPEASTKELAARLSAALNQAA
jgi:phage terminase large subunit GpA-like protein